MEISVVIPSYNYAHYLARAIDSVLAQTYPVKEVIVIDDGSTDDTREVVGKYDYPVKYVYQDNAGLSAARNAGIRLARTPWVGLLDSDDWWMPTKVEEQVKKLSARPDAVLAYTRIMYMWPDASKPGGWVGPDELWPRLRYSNPITPSTVIVRRAAVLEAGGFDESLRSCEDWDMWVRIFDQGSFVGVEEPLTAYHMTPASMSRHVQRMVDNTELIIDKSLLKGLSGVSRMMWRRRIQSAALYYAALASRENGNARETQSYLFRSIAQWPSPNFLPKRWWTLLRLITHSASPMPEG